MRRWLTPEEAAASGQTVTDVIGVLEANDPAGLTVRRDTRSAVPGEPPVWIEAGVVVAAKRIPPRRTPRR